MLPTSICRCICGTKSGGQFDPQNGLGSEFDNLEDANEPAFQPPPFAGLLSYSAAVDQHLRGEPIRSGELWYLSSELEPVAFTLYVNGFSFVHKTQEMSIALSPFSLVRNCKFQNNYSNMELTEYKIFKVSLFTHGICYYFGVRGVDEEAAEEARSRWVLDISRAMRLVTQSLFPPFSISCDPVAAVANTRRRLMAGYLVHHDDACAVSVLYCELHPQEEEKAKLVLYENELCQTPVMDVYITVRTICCEKCGINCSSFCVDDHQFSSRTLAERKLWLRAISNVKVKLQNAAPSPGAEELQDYRSAIKEHVSTIASLIDGLPPTDALLQRNVRSSFTPTDPESAVEFPVQSTELAKGRCQGDGGMQTDGAFIELAKGRRGDGGMPTDDSVLHLASIELKMKSDVQDCPELAESQRGTWGPAGGPAGSLEGLKVAQPCGDAL